MEKFVTLPGTLPGLLEMYAPVVPVSGEIEAAIEQPALGVLLRLDRGGYWHVEGNGWAGGFRAADLALNLSTPEGMCRAARWLAERLGMDPGATAPKWFRCGDDDGPVIYELQCRHRRTVIVHDDDEGPVGEFDGEIGLRVRGIDKASANLDAAVLAAACLAVGDAAAAIRTGTLAPV
jgi:hypothetical protein